MTDEKPDADDVVEFVPDAKEEEGYEPEPVGLNDGDIMIFDRFEFEAAFECYAAQNRNGHLFVLKKDTRKWECAEPEDKPKTRGGLGVVGK